MDGFFEDLEALRNDVEVQMKQRKLYWDMQPVWSTAPASGTVSGQVELMEGRLAMLEGNRMEFVGPFTDERDFWICARNVVLDTDWN